MDAQIVAFAQTAYDSMERATRDDASIYYRMKDDAPEWVSEIVRAVHGDMLPDDFRYEAIRSALSYIADNEDADEDAPHDFADSETDVYTGRLIEWLGSNLTRVGYCDDAADEFGTDADAGIVQRIQLGQYAEYREVFEYVVQGLREHAES